MYPSIKLRRQHCIGHSASVAKRELRAACCALLRRYGEGGFHLPALQSGSIVGRAQRRDIELQGRGWVQQRREKRGCGEKEGMHCFLLAETTLQLDDHRFAGSKMRRR